MSRNVFWSQGPVIMTAAGPITAAESVDLLGYLNEALQAAAALGDEAEVHRICTASGELLLARMQVRQFNRIMGLDQCAG